MTLGAELRAAREAVGMSLDDVAAATRVRASVIAAVEDDDFAVLGPDVYARGHLRTIATVVGLDGDDVVARYADPGSEPAAGPIP